MTGSPSVLISVPSWERLISAGVVSKLRCSLIFSGFIDSRSISLIFLRCFMRTHMTMSAPSTIAPQPAPTAIKRPKNHCSLSFILSSSTSALSPLGIITSIVSMFTKSGQPVVAKY